MNYVYVFYVLRCNDNLFFYFIFTLGMFLMCWVPFFTCNILDAICIKLENDTWRPGVTLFLLTTWLGYVNSCVNPVIYTIFNLEFRKAFKKLLLDSWHCWLIFCMTLSVNNCFKKTRIIVVKIKKFYKCCQWNFDYVIAFDTHTHS